MKFKIVVLIFIFPMLSFAQGINWEKSLDIAFEKAKKEKKDVFIEFYSPNCPYCKELDPILGTKEVYDFYNQNFVNYRIDTQTPEAQTFVDSMVLDIYAIPYFLFFDSERKILHAREVSANVNSVLQPGRMTKERTYAAVNYPERFEKGERGENFLSQYALFTRVTLDEKANRKTLKALWETLSEEKRASQTSWVYAKKLSIDSENPFVEYWMKHPEKAKSFEPNAANFENAVSRLLYGTMFNSEAENFSSQKWKSLSDTFGKALGEKEVFSLIWERYLLALIKEKKENEVKELSQKALVIFKEDEASKKYFLDKLKSSTEELSPELKKWISGL